MTFCVAWDNLKITIMADFKIGACYVRDASQRWKFAPDVRQKGIRNHGRAFDFRNHAIRSVLNKAVQSLFNGQTVNKGSKTDPLNHTGKKIPDSFYIFTAIF